jgi:hypothetical protein
MKGDNVYRCRFCGKFYSSPLPEATACRDHQDAYSEWLRKDIERFNAKLKAQAERT